MARLLLALLCASAVLWAAQGGAPTGKCGVPMAIENAVPEDNGGMRLRYTCRKDYKRKAGHSSLVVCKLNEKTNTSEWVSNLICIRDPSVPESVHTMEDTRTDTETPTPTSQPVPPKMSANPAVFYGDPYGNKTTWLLDPITATTPLTTAKPSPEEATSMDTHQENRGGVFSTNSENVTPRKETMTRDSWLEGSKPSVSSKPSREISSTTSVPSRNAPDNTTGVSEVDIQQGQTGASQLKAVFFPIAVFILVLFLAGGSWYCYRRCSHFRRQGDVVEDIPMAERSEERDWMLSVGRGMADAGPAEEETPMQLSDCATSTG